MTNENDMMDAQDLRDEQAERAAEDALEGYQEYIMANNGGGRLICNGDDLIGCVESGYLFQDFVDKKFGEMFGGEK